MLSHELAGLRVYTLHQRLAFLGLQHADHDRLAVVAEARPHDHGIEVCQHEVRGRGFAQPPYVERRQSERLVEQALAEAFEEGHEGRRLDDAGAQRIGELDAAAARRFDQAGDAQRRIGAQFQRVDEGAVEAAQQHVYRPQPGQSLQRYLAVAGHQIATLDQRHPQCPGEVDVLEIGRRQRAWRQHRHVGLGDVGRRQRQQRIVPAVDEGPEMADRDGAERLGQAARQHPAHLQRIADAGRHLGMIGQHMPAAVAQPHQVDGVVCEMTGRRRTVGDLAGPVEMPVGVNQHRRQQPLLEKALRAVDVGQDGVEQASALDQAGLERRPLVGCHDEGQRIERPARRRAVVEQIDGGSRFLELPPRAFHALAQPARQRADDAQDALPVIADRLLAGNQLVVGACRRRKEAAQRLHGPAEGRNWKG